MNTSKGDFDLARAQWQKFGDGATDDAVEIAFVDNLIGIRNSADPSGTILVFTQSEWDAFVAGVKDGEFTIPSV